MGEEPLDENMNYMTPDEMRKTAVLLREFNARLQDDGEPLGSPNINLAANQLDWAAAELEGSAT